MPKVNAWRRAGRLLALIPAASCVSFRAQPVRPEDTAAALVARRLDGEELHACMQRLAAPAGVEWPVAAWDLDRLTAAAFCSSPALAEARAAAAAASAAVITAGARQEPSLNVTAEYQSDAEHGVSPWVLGPAIDVPLTTAGKREIRIAQARNLAEAARLDLMAAAWEARGRVRSALVALHAAGELEGVLRSAVEAQAAAVESVEAQRREGAASSPEVAAARVRSDELRLDLATARGDAAAARSALAGAIGVPVSALAGATIQPAFPAPAERPAGDNARAAALRTRADVLAAVARYEASQDALRLAVAGQYPDIHLGPGFLWDQGASRWQLGVSLALPLLERNRGPIAEAAARRAEAAARVTAVQADALAEIDAANADVDATAARLGTADVLVARHEVLAEAARRGRAAGELDRLDALLAEAGLWQARRARVEAWREAERARGRLEQALQQPLDGARLPPVPLAGSTRQEERVQ